MLLAFKQKLKKLKNYICNMILPCLYIETTANKGRAVFTAEDLPADTIIEVAPVIAMSAKERAILDTTLLHDYIFEWGNDSTKCCVALGYVSIYNHSYNSNCTYFMDFDAQTIMIKTVTNIKSGEEVTINYNGDNADENKVWFDAV
jgi:uncharacterized protein